MTRDRQATAAAICEDIALGSSLRKACEAQGITHSGYLQWLDGDKMLADQYARARELGWALLADEVLTIADTPVVGVKTKTNEAGEVEKTEGDMIEHRRLQVDTRKWMLSKMLPKVYGDKHQIEHSGEIGIADRIKRAEDKRKACP